MRVTESQEDRVVEAGVGEDVQVARLGIVTEDLVVVEASHVQVAVGAEGESGGAGKQASVGEHVNEGAGLAIVAANRTAVDAADVEVAVRAEQEVLGKLQPPAPRVTKSPR
jgi:hypothetical protein